MSKIQFSVSYQYQNQGIGNQIFKEISRDFGLPGWIEKVYQKQYQHKKEYQNKKGYQNQKKYQNEEGSQFFKVQVVDARKIRKDQGKWVFLKHNLKEDAQIWKNLVLKKQDIFNQKVESQFLEKNQKLDNKQRIFTQKNLSEKEKQQYMRLQIEQKEQIYKQIIEKFQSQEEQYCAKLKAVWSVEDQISQELKDTLNLQFQKRSKNRRQQLKKIKQIEYQRQFQKEKIEKKRQLFSANLLKEPLKSQREKLIKQNMPKIQKSSYVYKDQKIHSIQIQVETELWDRYYKQQVQPQLKQLYLKEAKEMEKAISQEVEHILLEEKALYYQSQLQKQLEKRKNSPQFKEKIKQNLIQIRNKNKRESEEDSLEFSTMLKQIQLNKRCSVKNKIQQFVQLMAVKNRKKNDRQASQQIKEFQNKVNYQKATLILDDYDEYERYLYVQLWNEGLTKLNSGILDDEINNNELQVIFFLKIQKTTVVPFFVIKRIPESLYQAVPVKLKDKPEEQQQIVKKHLSKDIKKRIQINNEQIQKLATKQEQLKKVFREEFLKFRKYELQKKDYEEMEDNPRLTKDKNDSNKMNMQIIKQSYKKVNKDQIINHQKMKSLIERYQKLINNDNIENQKNLKNNKKIKKNKELFSILTKYYQNQQKLVKQFAKSRNRLRQPREQQQFDISSRNMIRLQEQNHENQNKHQIKEYKLKKVQPKSQYKTNQFIFNLLTQNLWQYQIEITKDERQLNINERKAKEIQGIKNIQGMKSLTLNFNITKLTNIFGPLQKSHHLYHQSIVDNISRNKFLFIKKRMILRDIKKSNTKHYNLAFQGGGAKGYAYIGAYKALVQYRVLQSDYQRALSEHQIPIKCIIGSSAGGIVAIAASAGIHWSQIEQICSKMNKITLMDRIKRDQPSFDIYGNKITFAQFEMNLRKLLKQYGIMNEELFDTFSKFVKSEDFHNVIEQKLVNLLNLALPNLSPIFADYNIKQQQTRRRNLFFKQTLEVQRTLVNWTGLLLHGALMNGKAISSIASQCLYKYLVKQKLQSRINLQDRLRDAFQQSNRYQDPAQQALSIINKIDQLTYYMHTILGYRLSQLPLGNSSKFLVYLLNLIFLKVNSQIPKLYKGFNQGKNQLNLLQFDDLSDCLNFSRLQANKLQYQLNIQNIAMIRLRNIFNIEQMEINADNISFWKQLQCLKRQQYNLHVQIIDFLIKVRNNNMLEYFRILSIRDDINQILKEMESYNAQQYNIYNRRILPFTHNMISFFNKIRRLNQCQNYQDIISVVGTTVLLDYLQIQLVVNDEGEFVSDFTISDFVRKAMFRVGQNQYEQDQMNTLVWMLQLERCIPQFFPDNTLGPDHILTVYKTKYDLMLQRLEQITTKQYYCLNGVQFTCTSVDLDDKKLRFFNHKTTPDLPVCKAVQLTGSFPVAFKSNYWQRQWRNYHIQKDPLYQQRVIIRGHQFTDGGLLANFPIKYLDNADISNQYFSHAHQEGKTIMLGFGLDAIQEQFYNKTPQKIKDENLRNVQIARALQELKDSLPKKCLFLSAFWNSGSSGQDFVKIGQLDDTIVDKIPLLRFIKKIISGYPNADRNLNTQAFSKRIIQHQMTDINDLQTNKLIIYNMQNMEIFKKQLKDEKRWKVMKYFRQWQQFRRILRPNQQHLQIQAQSNRISQIILSKNNILNNLLIERRIALKDGFIKNYRDPFNPAMNQQTIVQQKIMSKYILNILLITLRDFSQNQNGIINNNKKVHNALSERYAYYKNMAQQEQKNNIEDTRRLNLNNNFNVKPKLNRLNVKNLFNNYQLDEISNRLNFKNAKTNYIEIYKDQNIKADQIGNKRHNHIHTKYLRQLQSNIVGQDSFFANPYTFYVNTSMHRLIRYVYLQVKSKTQLYKDNLQKIARIVQQVQEDSLLSQSNSFQHLRFDQILLFMNELSTTGVLYEGQRIIITFQASFQRYLRQVLNNRDNPNGWDVRINIVDRIKVSLKNQLFNLGFLWTDNNAMKQFKNIQQMVVYPQSIQFCRRQIAHRLLPRPDLLRGIISMEDLSNQQYLDFLNFILYEAYIDHSHQNCNISQQTQSHIKQVRRQSLNCITKLFFGERYQSLEFNGRRFFEQQANNLTDQLHNNGILNFPDNLQSRDFFNHLQLIIQNKSRQFAEQGLQMNVFCSVQKQTFSRIYHETLKKYIDYKICFDKADSQQKRKQSRNLKQIHHLYYQDINYITRFIKAIILIIYEQRQSQLDSNEILINNSIQSLYRVYNDIRDEFMKKYNKLSEMATNQLDTQSLNNTFLITFNSSKKIVQTICQLKQLKNPLVDQTIKTYLERNISLPLFKAESSVLHKLQNIIVESVVEKKYRIMNGIRLPQRNVSNNKNLHSAIDYLVSRIKSPQYQRLRLQQTNIHLLLQGSGNSSDYYSAYYQALNILMQQQRQKIKIKLITCSGYHSIFGFLLGLGKDISQIREDMLRISQYPYKEFDKKKIKEFFKKEGTYKNSENFISLSLSLKQQISTVFQRFKDNIKDHREKFDYQKCFYDIREMIDEQQNYYTQACHDMLNSAQEKLKEINYNHINPVQPKQISKQLAINYKCSFEKRHKYEETQKQFKKFYFQIMDKFYDEFGQILSAVFCNALASNSPINIESDEIQHFTKGILIMKILTVYKLKEFIYEQLQIYGFSRNITLKQWYDRSQKSTRKILNFCVINVSQQRFEMLNKLQTPRMPVWAAIMATSSLPIFHRHFWCERQWQELNECPKYHELKQMRFFDDAKFFKREMTFYNTSTYVSSLPMEMMTNKTMTNKVATYDEDEEQRKKISSLILIGIAFQPSYSGNLLHHQVERKSLDISWKNFFQIIWFKMSSPIKEYKFIQFEHDKRHYNNSYEHSYDLLSVFTAGLFGSSLISAFKIFTNCNDNFIMKWYYDRLIKLPIKCDTLQFNKFADEKIFSKYGINVPSKIALQTSLRSEEITKTFIHQIQNRGSHVPPYYNPELINQYRMEDRYRIRLRVDIVKNLEKSTGFQKNYFKILLVNHTKWNKNVHNNFVVEYCIGQPFSQAYEQLQRAQNSEIIWPAQESTKITLRFYHLQAQYKLQGSEYKYDSRHPTCIYYSDFLLDFKELNKHLPFRASYDYIFPFALYQYPIRVNQERTLIPEFINGIQSSREIRQSAPLFIKTITRYEMKNTKKEYVNSTYIKSSQYVL